MFWFDRVLLREFEKLAHGFQRLTGKDNFWIGWAFFCGYVALMNVNASMVTRDMTVLCFINLINLVFFLFVRKVTEDARREMYRSHDQMSRNPLEINPLGRFERRLFTIIVIIDILSMRGFSGTLVDVIILSMWYFFSVTPLPPGKSLFSRIVDSVKSLLAPVEPMPEGMPV